MEVSGFDERGVRFEGSGGDFVVFVYRGGDVEGLSWSVDSYLLVDAHLPEALRWLEEHVPEGCCWSLGVVLAPERPTPTSDLTITWVVGDDVLNRDLDSLTDAEQALADEMLARRHRVDLLLDR